MGRRWGLKTAKINTGDQFITDKTKLKEIINEYKPDLIDEEATAIAKILKNNPVEMKTILQLRLYLFQ